MFGVWGAIIGALSYSGFYENTEAFPPRILTVLLPTSLLVFYLFKVVDTGALNLGWLFSIHLVRVPVELILHELYLQGSIPEIMTYSGWNFDILSGLSAGIILVLHHTNKLSKQMLKVWNWSTLLLLIIIVKMAILSSPSPVQCLAFDQPNAAILSFPFTWLPAIVVPIVLMSHLFIFRVINLESKTAHFK